MLFIAMFFLVFALFVVARVFRGSQAIWLGLTLFTFGCCIVGLAGLVPRFGNYRLDGILSLPLDQPDWAWRLLERLSLYDFMRFRLWSAVGFVIATVIFATAYSAKHWKLPEIAAGVGLALISAFLLWYYDPEHLFKLYNTGAGMLTSPESRQSWENGLRTWDILALCLIISAFIYSLVRLGKVLWESSIIQKKVQAFCVGIGVLVLTIFFILLFCIGRVSVLNGHTMATTLLPLGPRYPVFDSTFLRAVPLAAIIAMVAVMVAILRYGFLGNWPMGVRNLEQQINIANQAVRLALHSFKNRFLAVQMAMDMASGQLDALVGGPVEKARIQIAWAKDVCVEALGRLEVMHIQAKRLEVNLRWLLLRDLWEAAMNCCSSRLEGIQISCKYPTGNLYIWGDREHLISVLDNLLQNALDAMAEKQGEEYHPALYLEINQEYEWGYFRVTDNGSGIARENLHKVFRPFFTSKPAKNNWGLGLTYCHRVIKMHRGFINLHSQLGKGTTVEVVLRCRKNLNGILK